jgi:perosamine synthetase
MVAAYVGCKYAVATVNGTAALHTSLLVSGIKPDDEVILPTLTFIAPANAVRYVGAWPTFLDVEPQYFQLDPDKLEYFIKKQCKRSRRGLINKATGRRVSAIMPVHILGHPVYMNSVNTLAREYDLRLIEDATESLGAKFKGKMVGKLGDIACFSFNGNKIITTGGGGMIVTNNREWAQKARYLTTQAKDNELEFVHNEIGYNYRLSNVAAAIGCAQMEQLNGYIAKKREIAAGYASGLAGIEGIKLMNEAPWAFSTYWLYTVLISGGSRATLKRLADAGIQTRPLWQPMHMSPAHRASFRNDCFVSEKLYMDALSLPSSAGLSDEDQVHVNNMIGVVQSKK